MSNQEARAIIANLGHEPEPRVRAALRQLSGIGTRQHQDFMQILWHRKAA